ncbi:hypothetical protein ONQ97_26035, partial [Salmonella enterica subsp. enterica serovar Virginia]|nr:hypothetical protein [Salmonella enterica subsp. enterica serovar Virginia]
EEQQLEALRQFKQTQLLRIAAADIAGTLPVMKVSDHLTWLADDFKKELKKKPITKTMRDFFLNQNSSKMYVSFDLGLSSDEEII